VQCLILYTDGDSEDVSIEQMDRMTRPTVQTMATHQMSTKTTKSPESNATSIVRYWCVHCKGHGPLNRRLRDEHYALYHSGKYVGKIPKDGAKFDLIHPKASTKIIKDVLDDLTVLLMNHTDLMVLQKRFGNSRPETIRSLERLNWMCAR
jgi:hypothetical protein|tara:strand:+ start:194 stop:643 length:450 start_codon:yes stop_codon:yes gene_type:complete